MSRINNNLRFETTKVASVDRATDSDQAVVSSEDEHETIKQNKPSFPSAGGHAHSKPGRRSSFLSEIKADPKRRSSVTGFYATNNSSQPSTPSAENNPPVWTFGSTLTKVASTGSASNNAWSPNASIWGNDLRSSQMSLNLPPTVSYTENGGPLVMRDTLDEVIPFSIPLHPTPKAYRSQSYSVGQMESELDLPGSPMQGTGRMKHKPSRLNEVEHAPTLEELNEGDDEGSDAGVPLGSPRLWDRVNYTNLNHSNANYSPERLSGNVLAKRFIPSTNDGSNDSTSHGVEQISYTADEHARYGMPGQHASLMVRPQWQTTPSFDYVPGPPQSRRHSTTDANLEESSLAGDAHPANGANMLNAEYRQQATDIEENMVQKDMDNRAWAQNYFAGNVPAARSQTEAAQRVPENPRISTGAYPQGPSPGVFSRPGFDTPLYIVAFKCARADVYYVQPGTGLEVNEGDLVMVEADRGYDLGTVTHARVSWPRARELKEKALDEHFRWLMMFSRHNQDLTTNDPQNFQGLLANKGPQERDPGRKGFGISQHDSAYNQDIKPRLIKRRAFNHEIASLREKEGNEAKAKRTCQQKSREHGCEMEILDAEFQIDWKKLTFYFYAPKYINFNPLVTELYKVYKVRIWMSAINPGSYPSHATRPPSSIGPGAMEGRDTPIDQSVTSINDPDPEGAIPPHLNPASDTYMELNRDTAARDMAAQDSLHPLFTSGFRQGQDHNRSEQSRQLDRSVAHTNAFLPSHANSMPWGSFNFPHEAPRGAPYLSNNQAIAGAHAPPAFNPAVSRPSPAQRYGGMGHAMSPPSMSPPPMPNQPWNVRPNPRPLNPLSPPATFGGLGGDWSTRAFANMSLNSDPKERR